MNKRNYSKIKKQRYFAWGAEVLILIFFYIINIKFLTIPLLLYWPKGLLSSIVIIILVIIILNIEIFRIIRATLEEIATRKLYQTKRGFANRIDNFSNFFGKYSDLFEAYGFTISPNETQYKNDAYDFYYKNHLIFKKAEIISIEDYVSWESLCAIYVEFQKLIKDINKLETDLLTKNIEMKSEKRKHDQLNLEDDIFKKK